VSKARLDGAGSTLGWWHGSLPVSGGVERDGLYNPFQPRPSYDSSG